MDKISTLEFFQQSLSVVQEEENIHFNTVKRNIIHSALSHDNKQNYNVPQDYEDSTTPIWDSSNLCQ